MRFDRSAQIKVIDFKDRTRSSFVPTLNPNVTCTAGLGTQDLVDSTIYSTIQNSGGFGLMAVTSGDVVMYKLEYVLNDPSYGGTNNNCYLLTGYSWP